MELLCTLKSLADLGEGGFGILAATFWFWSASVSWNLFRRPRIGDMTSNAQKSNVLNAIAAACAGVVALLQFFVHFAPVCRSFS
jgi:hypothetical protein